MESHLTPEEVSRGWGSTVRDDDLPMLAAQWLAEGWDSDELRELAALSSADAKSDAHRLLPAVLASLGFDEQRPLSPWEDMHWRGYWGQVAWARDEMDRLLTPYA